MAGFLPDPAVSQLWPVASVSSPSAPLYYTAEQQVPAGWVSAHCAGYAAHKCFLFALDLSKKETQNFFFICTNLFIQDMAND